MLFLLNGIMSIIILCSFFILPPILTVLNLLNLISKNKYIPNIVDAMIMTLGPIFSILLFKEWAPEDYQQALYFPGYFKWHTPLAYQYMPTIIVLVIVGLIGYGVLRIFKTRLSPLIILICISCMLITVFLSIVWIVQLSTHLFEGSSFGFDVLYMCLFPFNYIICFINITRKVMAEYSAEEQAGDYKNTFIAKCAFMLQHSKNWPIMAFVMMIPILSIIFLILVVFGQQPNAVIKAFTETSDWMLSQKVSPPPIEVDAHYLCTVSLRGHPTIVKPLRYGIRGNHKIVVNRQLCVANAFEQLMQQRTPKVHCFIRHIYDKYGYPLSKHIITPLSADVVYIVMKPLEWFFVFILYLFDEKPEDRIAVQYLPVNYGLKEYMGR